VAGYQTEEGKPTDMFTWIYRLDERGEKQYLAGTAGRIRVAEAQLAVAALNEFSLCVGECR
jgi:hypothetical protein